MPFPLHVVNPRVITQVTTPRRVPLVRFVRAIGGAGAAGQAADEASPELDDRGLAISGSVQGPHMPLTAPARGQVGIMQRLQVIRDRLEPTAQLFPKLSSSSRMELIHPVAGSALNPNAVPGTNGVATFDGDTIHFRTKPGAADKAKVELRLHFGSASGPVVGEMEFTVFKPITMPVKVHRMTIDGTQAVMSDADIQAMIRDMGHIYAQAGVRLQFALADIINEPNIVFGNSPTPPAANLPPGVVLPPGTVLPSGTILIPNSFSDATQLATVLNTNADRNSLNAYLLPHIFTTFNNSLDSFIGFGLGAAPARIALTNPTPAAPRLRRGFIMIPQTDAQMSASLIAHEVGHVLDLQHYDNRQAALQTAATPNPPLLRECFICRNLMHPVLGFPVFVETENGYGIDASGFQRGGQGLNIRRQSTIQQSDQITAMRRAVKRKTFRP